MFGNKKVDVEILSSESSAEEIATEEIQELSIDNISNNSTPKFIKPSVISEGFSFNGDIDFNGPLTVDGSVNGNISVDNLVIGVTGSVGGTVKANAINVKGKLNGTISCTEITVGGRSVIEGDLTYSSITIQRGGEVKGDLRRI